MFWRSVAQSKRPSTLSFRRLTSAARGPSFSTIATAMILSSNHIVTEKDHSYKGTEIWYDSELDKKIASSENRLKNLTKIFEEKEFYIHPIKLSKFS